MATPTLILTVLSTHYCSPKDIYTVSRFSKFSGLEILFRSIGSSNNYKEVDITIYHPQNNIIIIFFPFKNMFCVRKRNVSLRRFFYAHKTCV